MTTLASLDLLLIHPKRVCGEQATSINLRLQWNWAEATWIATGNKDLAFESVKEGIEM